MTEKPLNKQDQLKVKMQEWLTSQELADSRQLLDTHALFSKFVDDTVNYGRVARALSLKESFYIKRPFSHGHSMMAHFENMQVKPTVTLTIVLDDNYITERGVPLIELPMIAGTLDIEHPRKGRRAREDYELLGDVPMDLQLFV